MEHPYTNPKLVTAVRADERAPLSRNASGYGRQIPTRYWVRVLNRWHRVYAMSYGNAASLYVLIGRLEHFLDTDTEHRLEAVR